MTCQWPFVSWFAEQMDRTVLCRILYFAVGAVCVHEFLCVYICACAKKKKKNLFYPGGQQGGQEYKDISEVENMFFPHKEFTA